MRERARHACVDATDIRIVREMGLRPYGPRPQDPESVRDAAIARRLALDLKTVKARIERMSEVGFLRGHQIVPNLGHFGLEAAGYLYRITDADRKRDALKRIEVTDGLLEVHDFLGAEACIDLAYRSPDELSVKLREIGESVGDRAPVRFYDRTLPRVTRELSALDWRIIRSLRGRAHRPLAEVADELGVTLKTVRRRFDRMAREGSFFVAPMLDPSRATGLVLFELLVYTTPDAAHDTQRNVLSALDENHVYHYTPASRSLGNFDVLLFGESVATVERLRAAARSVPGVARVDPLLFQGWIDRSEWMDARIGAAAAG